MLKRTFSWQLSLKRAGRLPLYPQEMDPCLPRLMMRDSNHRLSTHVSPGLNDTVRFLVSAAIFLRQHRTSMKQEQAPAQVITCGDESATESQTANINTAASPNGRVVVPRDRRRGYFTRFTVIPETEDPTKDKPSEKWIITTVVALCGAVGPLGGAVIMR